MHVWPVFVCCAYSDYLILSCVCVLSHVWLFVIPWTIAHQAPLSKEFSRQEYWSVGCHFLFHLPDPGIKPTFLASPALAGRFFTTAPPGKSTTTNYLTQQTGTSPHLSWFWKLFLLDHGCWLCFPKQTINGKGAHLILFCFLFNSRLIDGAQQIFFDWLIEKRNKW